MTPRWFSQLILEFALHRCRRTPAAHASQTPTSQHRPAVAPGPHPTSWPGTFNSTHPYSGHRPATRGWPTPGSRNLVHDDSDATHQAAPPTETTSVNSPPRTHTRGHNYVSPRRLGTAGFPVQADRVTHAGRSAHPDLGDRCGPRDHNDNQPTREQEPNRKATISNGDNAAAAGSRGRFTTRSLPLTLTPRRGC